MAYDSKTFGTSPFSNRTATTSRSAAALGAARTPEALSDHMSEPGSEPDAAAERTDEQQTAPALPTNYRLLSKSSSKAALFYIPKGRIANLTMLGEALVWLMAWGTVGFFRAHVPPTIVAFFDALFAPWGMAGLTLVSGLLIGRLFRRYRIQIGKIRELAVLAVEYGEVKDRADAQVKLDRLLAEAEERTKAAGRWLVTWLTALGCLFIIGAFY